MTLYYVRVLAQPDDETYVAWETVVATAHGIDHALLAVRDAMRNGRQWEGEFKATATEALPQADAACYRWGRSRSKKFRITERP